MVSKIAVTNDQKPDANIMGFKRLVFLSAIDCPTKLSLATANPSNALLININKLINMALALNNAALCCAPCAMKKANENNNKNVRIKS